MVVIRSASKADARQVAAVMRDSWFAAYDGIIEPALIDRATAPDGGARVRQSFRTRPWQQMIAAVAGQSQQVQSQQVQSQQVQSQQVQSQQVQSQQVQSQQVHSQQLQSRRVLSRPAAAAPSIVGYASFGPERDVLGQPWPHPLTPAGSGGEVAELYALYVHPAWWSTGTGRALMDHVLGQVGAAGYACITLWVLEANARARRFYQRAGFAPDGARHLLEDFGVTEIRYRRALAGQQGRRPAGPSASRTARIHRKGARS